jgi:hypothetical protein
MLFPSRQLGYAVHPLVSTWNTSRMHLELGPCLHSHELMHHRVCEICLSLCLHESSPTLHHFQIFFWNAKSWVTLKLRQCYHHIEAHKTALHYLCSRVNGLYKDWSVHLPLKFLLQMWTLYQIHSPLTTSIS